MRCEAIFIAVTICIAIGCNSNGVNNNKTQINNDVAIGKLLFFDANLSITHSKSCGSCHDPKQYFTDGYKRTLGALADVQLRNTPSIINSVAKQSLNWADPNITTFVQQMATPLFSKAHVEMGMEANNQAQAKQVLQQPKYSALLPNNQDLNWAFIQHCISAYCSTIVSRQSIYDKYIQHQAQLTSQQQLGMQLFFSTKTKCSSCHGGIDFNTPTDSNNRFANTGLYNVQGNYANSDNGLANVTKRDLDIGKFAIPSLRNVEKTAPYYHDGSAANLLDVITDYSSGGRHITQGVWQGDGRLHANKSKLITGFTITEVEKKALVSFLYTLTDTSVVSNKSFISSQY
jgi:cytochrome c peroxidase